MDTGKGRFEQIPTDLVEQAKAEYPNHGGLFRVGEELEIKGSKFKVKAVKWNELRLKLLKK